MWNFNMGCCFFIEKKGERVSMIIPGMSRVLLCGFLLRSRGGSRGTRLCRTFTRITCTGWHIESHFFFIFFYPPGADGLVSGRHPYRLAS